MTAKAKQPPDRSFSKFFTPSELKHHAKTIKLSVLHWLGTNYSTVHKRESVDNDFFFYNLINNSKKSNKIVYKGQINLYLQSPFFDNLCILYY